MCLYLTAKKIILIDRDGVINEKVKKGNYVTSWKDFIWIKDTLLAMESLSNDGYSFIIITNQAGIARKKMTSADLNNIHNKMLDYLKIKGINVLDVYTCPHHWNENCDCRKPKPGMLIKASIDYSFRLDQSLFIGDDIRDAEAAHSAGVANVLINNDSLSKENLNDKINYYPALSDAIGFIKERVY
jgi:D-glycero-D-manno-heptose 1,7-bisphosphate phosphatase